MLQNARQVLSFQLAVGQLLGIALTIGKTVSAGRSHMAGVARRAPTPAARRRFGGGVLGVDRLSKILEPVLVFSGVCLT